MRFRLRQLALMMTALLPGFLKRAIYRWGFGYRLGRNVRIGVAYLDCDQLEIGDGTRIGHGVVFWRCGEVRIGQQVIIGPLNLFRGGRLLELGDWAQVLRLNVINAIPGNDCVGTPDPSFSLGYGAVITAEHRIDFTDRVSLGRCSMLGGRNSSIWTHNRKQTKPVEIGAYCYLGSELRIAPGVRVPDCSIVGLGSLLSHPLTESHTLIGGSPARPLRRLLADDYVTIFDKTRPDLPDENYPWPTKKAAQPQ